METTLAISTDDLSKELVYLRVSSYLITVFPITIFNPFVAHIMNLPNTDFDPSEKLLYSVITINDIFGGCLSAIVMSLMDLSSIVSIQNELCQCAISGVVMSFIFSSWLLLGFSLNKYIQVTRPLQFRRLLTTTRVGLYIIMFAAISLLVASLSLPLTGLPFADEGAATLCRGSVTSLSTHQIKIFASLIATLALSAIFIAIVNVRLLCIASRSSLKITPNSIREGALQRRVNIRGLKTIIITVLTSFIATAIPTIVGFVGPRLGMSHGVNYLTWFFKTLQLSTWWWKIFVFNATDVRFRQCSKKALQTLRENWTCRGIVV